jgi:hypothetical protein
MLFDHTFVKTTHKIQFTDEDFPDSLHGAVLVLVVSTSHAAKCNDGGFRDTILTGTGMELV